MSDPVFLDTNIFLRHLLNDDPSKSAACFCLIAAIEEGKQFGWTTDLVLAEVVFVLSNEKTYHLSREKIRDLLLPLIHLRNLKIAYKKPYDRIFELYTTVPIDYIDCYHAALLEQRKEPELYSYDTDFDTLPGITRREPEP
ncbi:MAG: type II toxin-antitoxin system VapC family toxin [Chloroflexi bacterium]|nr:type II toxin-antitoxin system VapC family toxin [Chloroflexota bacterium]